MNRSEIIVKFLEFITNPKINTLFFLTFSILTLHFKFN